MGRYCTLVVYAPKQYKDVILKKLFSLGAGKIGNYDSYSFVSSGITSFRPLKDSKPTIGKKGVVSKVNEVRIETIAPRKKVKSIMKEIKKIHPYEQPAIAVYDIL